MPVRILLALLTESVYIAIFNIGFQFASSSLPLIVQLLQTTVITSNVITTDTPIAAVTTSTATNSNNSTAANSSTPGKEVGQ